MGSFPDTIFLSTENLLEPSFQTSSEVSFCLTQQSGKYILITYYILNFKPFLCQNPIKPSPVGPVSMYLLLTPNLTFWCLTAGQYREL